MSRWDSSSDEERNEQKRVAKKAKLEEKTKKAESSKEIDVSSSSSSSSSCSSSSRVDVLVDTGEGKVKGVEEVENNSKIEGDQVEYNPLFHGCRSVDSYQRLNFIDQGTYGMVFKAKCRETGECFALKQVKSLLLDTLICSPCMKESIDDLKIPTYGKEPHSP